MTHRKFGLDYGVGHFAYIPTKNGVTRGVMPKLGSVGCVPKVTDAM
jgi:hypothetical protein